MTSSAVEMTFDRAVQLNWWDERANEPGFDACSNYVEQFWLPILGPSATLMLRYFSKRLASSPAGVTLDLAETACVLGLGSRAGRHAPFMRTMSRVIDFSMASLRGDDELLVRRRIPSLSPRHLARLPASLRASHLVALRKQPPREAPNDLRDSGQRLALSLIDIGERPPEVYAQLVRWRFGPDLARDCLERALACRTTMKTSTA